MPERLTKEEVNSKTDPSVAKQWDDETPVEKKFEDFYGIADGLGVCLLGTNRPGVGVSMSKSHLPLEFITNMTNC